MWFLILESYQDHIYVNGGHASFVSFQKQKTFSKLWKFNDGHLEGGRLGSAKKFKSPLFKRY